MDSASSDTYMKEDLAKKLKLPIKAENSSITLALSTSSGKVIGSTETNISINGNNYPRTKFKIILKIIT